MDVSPRLHNDTTLVPVRFVSEALGAKVSLDQPNQTVIIGN
ncbi:stalk domain-containing protein [Paenibacillus sp. Soil787]